MIRHGILLTLLQKEFTQIFRDIRMRVVLFVPPVAMLLVFGYAINTDLKNVRLAVWDEDRSAESRHLIEKFTGSGIFFVETYVQDEKTVNLLFDTGKIDMFLHIPPQFEQNLQNGKQVSLQILVDGTDSSRSSLVIAAMQGLFQEVMLPYHQKSIQKAFMIRQNGSIQALPSSIAIEERVFFNPGLSSRNFYLSGIFGLLISMITILLTAMSVVKERENNTLDQLIVSPLRPAELVVGKTLPYMIVGFVDTIMVSLLLIFWFHVPFSGSFLLLLLVSVEFLLTTTAIGLFISTISQNQQQAILTVVLFMLPALLFSGFAFPIESMPPVVQLLTYANPMRHFLDVVRGLFLKGAGIRILWPQILFLFVIGLSMFLVSGKRFAKHLE
ncbi:MAG: ABC transporter permease [Brevinematales bacterium]|nr:ABC transporter permease [Brevinematales bacterium]